MLKRFFGKKANTNYSIPQHIKTSIINRAIASQVTNVWTGGIEPTPALAQIRRVQNAEAVEHRIARDAAIAEAIAILASGRAEFMHSTLPEMKHQVQAKLTDNTFRVMFEQEMRRLGWMTESFHLNKVHYLTERIKQFNSERARVFSAKNEIEDANIELRAMIEKLRDKLVEQDEVIKKLIAGSSGGRKASLC